MNRKYQIDTQENRDFLKELRDDLLQFGHRFPSEQGGSYYLGDDGKIEIVRPGSPAGCAMYTASDHFSDTRAVSSWWMRR